MGTLALIFAIVGWSVDVLLEKLAIRTMNPESVAFLYGALEIILLPCWYLAKRNEIRFSDFTASGVAWASLASVASFATYYAYAYSLRRFPASIVSAYGLTSTAVAVFLCWLFLGESVTVTKATGVAVMIIGAWILGR